MMIYLSTLWNDELCLLSLLGKSWCDLFDRRELDKWYALGKVCAFFKMSKVACMVVLPKLTIGIILIIKLNREWSKKSLYWLMLLSDVPCWWFD